MRHPVRLLVLFVVPGCVCLSAASVCHRSHSAGSIGANVPVDEAADAHNPIKRRQ
jgi:hypothetical protein